MCGCLGQFEGLMDGRPLEAAHVSWLTRLRILVTIFLCCSVDNNTVSGMCTKCTGCMQGSDQDAKGFYSMKRGQVGTTDPFIIE